MGSRIASRLPALKGALLALFAATLLGVSAPFVQRMGPFSTAALLYAGGSFATTAC